MKVLVDWNLCEGHGQCEYAAPDVFTIDDDGDLEVLDETPDESQRKAVEQAVRRCPVRALAIEG
ncbi:ferredoxin [Gordonia rubripertincta]|uniref:Ferredoxin n=2 Tax=Gordonia rubripertincta TaxID=36822 RepID=A0AAW6RD93_GORRU|nr:ferredoxin [Gordonia rubripertincta]ASR02064.1 Ferredoxin fas2 [Gordonia rubripertincta]MDG6782416.1 ferredoxin [Gordonia rubripertincta]NKY64513.1 ferredoxin [Gordonia rubripertincta]GAB84922.1 putative 3Fe-4S ferredoxin [Gordonia rubripertincta NBRC 101908]